MLLLIHIATPPFSHAVIVSKPIAISSINSIIRHSYHRVRYVFFQGGPRYYTNTNIIRKKICFQRHARFDLISRLYQATDIQEHTFRNIKFICGNSFATWFSDMTDIKSNNVASIYTALRFSIITCSLEGPLCT